MAASWSPLSGLRRAPSSSALGGRVGLGVGVGVGVKVAVAVGEGRGVRLAVAVAVAVGVALGVSVGRAVAEAAALGSLATTTLVAARAGGSGGGVEGALAQPATSRQAMRDSHSNGCQSIFWIRMESIMPAIGMLVNPAKSPRLAPIGGQVAARLPFG